VTQVEEARQIIADLEAADVPNVLLKHVQIAGRAFDLLRKMIAEAPSPATGSAVPASTASPSPVGEGQVTDALSAIREVRSAISHNWCNGLEATEDQIDEWASKLDIAIAALAAQAPKPASGGGKPDWRRIANRLGEHLKTHPIVHTCCEKCQRVLSEYEEAFAAEADTAKEPPRDKPFCTLSGNPAADRLAQTVTDAEKKE
jgi:hypothetical protein